MILLSQDKISQSHVMVVGCGALGNEVLKNLVLMGVKHIVAVDFDIVEMGNLSRSVLFRKADAENHRLKIDVVAERLQELNPEVEVKTISGNIAYDVGLGVIRDMDVVICCVDSQWARYCINRLCMRAGVPWVDGGIYELEGTVRVFMLGVNCYACNLGDEGKRDLQRRMPCTGIIRRQEQVGSAPTTAIIASIIGAVQVQEALKLILGDESLTSLCGKVFYYEGGNLTSRIANFKAYDDDCAEHELWEPVELSRVKVEMTVGEALDCIAKELGTTQVEICLRNDCFVDYVAERSTNKQTQVMLPGRLVEAFVEKDERLSGIPLSGLYQHEYRRLNKDFPYLQLTLQALGIPEGDVLCVDTDAGERYLELTIE